MPSISQYVIWFKIGWFITDYKYEHGEETRENKADSYEYMFKYILKYILFNIPPTLTKTMLKPCKQWCR